MKDPVDHARTTRPHAGESVENGQNVPGLLAVAIAVVVLMISVYYFATGQSMIGGTTLIIALAFGFIGGWWLSMTQTPSTPRHMTGWNRPKTSK